MWQLGFFFHEMAFGLLSVFLPLYIFSLSGSLIWVGTMYATALFMSIPASFFWGYICDRTRRYKIYILISFLALAFILYLFILTNQIILLVTLYIVMALFHVAHEPPKNVLIAELYPHEEWKKAFAFYEGLTEFGWLIGLILGVVTSTFSFDAKSTLLLCSGLNLAAFFASLILVEDPTLIFERSLVTIEKSISFAYRGVSIFSRIVDGVTVDERLKKENLGIFCCGLVLFSLATSILFTPMPIFISNVANAATLPSSFVFAVFVLNSGSGVLGYFLAGRRLERETENVNVGRIVLYRSFLAFLLITTTQLSMYSIMIATVILILSGFTYAFYLVNVLSLSMELIPKGRAGLFDVLVGIGGASGSFIGPFLAQTYNFGFVFLISGILFLLSYIAFKMFV
ncbi:MAG: MFS transporter [Candidatus Bathyarchaeia archaeon]